VGGAGPCEICLIFLVVYVSITQESNILLQWPVMSTATRLATFWGKYVKWVTGVAPAAVGKLVSWVVVGNCLAAALKYIILATLNILYCVYFFVIILVCITDSPTLGASARYRLPPLKGEKERNRKERRNTFISWILTPFLQVQSVLILRTLGYWILSLQKL
jgi:hypothetical protein